MSLFRRSPSSEGTAAAKLRGSGPPDLGAISEGGASDGWRWYAGEGPNEASSNRPSAVSGLFDDEDELEDVVVSGGGREGLKGNEGGEGEKGGGEEATEKLPPKKMAAR